MFLPDEDLTILLEAKQVVDQEPDTNEDENCAEDPLHGTDHRHPLPILICTETGRVMTNTAAHPMGDSISGFA
jgi:hypothetical protein